MLSGPVHPQETLWPTMEKQQNQSNEKRQSINNKLLKTCNLGSKGHNTSEKLGLLDSRDLPNDNSISFAIQSPKVIAIQITNKLINFLSTQIYFTLRSR